MVSDAYKKQSIKTYTRDKRGEEEWNEFFNNIHNKPDLISQATKFYLNNESNKDIPLFINDGDTTYKITEKNYTPFYLYNHEEADTKMIYHASLEDAVTEFVATDPDVLLLLGYAYVILKPSNKWFMKIGHKKFVDIGKIVQCYGIELFFYMPHIHALFGCDCTSYIHHIWEKLNCKTLFQLFFAILSIYICHLAITPIASILCILVFQNWCHCCTKHSHQWLQILLIILSNDVSRNPGPQFHNSFFNFMSWNVNSIAKDDFQRVRLIEAHNSIFKYDLVSICETSLNDSIKLPDFLLNNYTLCIPKIQQTLGMVELVCSPKILSQLRSEMICPSMNR